MDPISIGLVFGALAAILSFLWLISKLTNGFKDSIKKDFNVKLASNKEFYEEKFKNLKEERKEHNKSVDEKIDDAKEYIDLRHSESIREIGHIKEVQEGKLTEMSKKIDELREQVTKGQAQTMDILTKLLIKEE